MSEEEADLVIGSVTKLKSINFLRLEWLADSIWFKHRQSLSQSLATFDFTNGYANCPAERGYS